MALNWVTMPVVETLTNAWQLIFVNPDSTQTFKGTVQDILDLTGTSVGSSLPVESMIWACDYTNTPANIVKFDIEAAQAFNFMTGKSSANSLIDDVYIYEFDLEPGNYTMEVLYQTNNYCGRPSIYIDGVKQGEIDMYSAALVNNVVSTIPVTIVGTEKHTLLLQVEAKNASATAYGVRLTRFRIF